MNAFQLSAWRCATIWLLILLGFVEWKGHAAERVRPNFVFILIDDLGWSDVGCNRSTFHRTPHIDRMAREGMRFTSAYAAAPICSPTRAALLTGQSPARLHLTDWLPGRADRVEQKLRRPEIVQQLPSSTSTVAEVLREAGYRTAHIGKWHLGGEGSLPQDHGFEVNVAGDHTGTPLSYFAPFRKGDRTMPGLAAAEPGEYLTDRLTTEAERFIEANRSQPFFLYLSHYAVHIPLAAKSNIVERYRGAPTTGSTQSNALYAAMVESMDESVGRILNALARFGLDERTLVIFTSDNGGLSVREGPNTPATSNAPWRAGKGHLYEGGLRVPLVVRWPGNVPADRGEGTPVISTDWRPTLLELAGVPAETARSLDGASLVSLLRGKPELEQRELYWHYPHYSNQGGKPAGAVRSGEWKLIEHYESGYLELFHLGDDPSENTNRAGDFSDRANAMAGKLASWRRDCAAQMMTANPQYVPNPVPQLADGTVRLAAHEAVVHGTTLRYEPPAHKNTIGYWTKPEDWVSWTFAVQTPGEFAVEILQGCGKGSGGSEVEILAGEDRLVFTVQDTGHFQKFVLRELGVVRIRQAGVHTLSVKPIRKPGLAVMDLRQVVLKPKGR